MNDLSHVAIQAIKLMDLTTLNDNDSDETVIELCKKANTSFGNTAAVCVYPRFVPIARKQLNKQGTGKIKIATVVNFPHGNDDIDIVLTETKAAIAYGADEIDVVFPYRALMAGNSKIGFELVRRCKQLCGVIPLKVIIESGELKTEDYIRRATEISIEAGADFIKTSTGKVRVNATLEASDIMLTTINEMGVKDRVGFKAAGGVRTTEEAKLYIETASRILGGEWVTSKRYRFGASSLLANLLTTLGVETATAEGVY